MARIGLLSIGMRGHVRPLARLGRVLADHGHQLIAWAPADFRDELEPAPAEFVAHEPVPVRVPDFSIPRFAVDLAEGTARCAREVIDQFHAYQLELVIHDIHVPWARIATEFLGLPRIVSTALFPWSPGPALGGDEPPAPSPTPSPFRDPIRDAGARIHADWGVELGG